MARAANAPLLTDRQGEVLTVTLNRPERRNALDMALITALRELWADKDALRGVRCVIVTGAAPGFCSGADMSLLSSDRSTAVHAAREELSFLPGHQIGCPVIVAVNGVCAGGGLHFVADADIALACDTAYFTDPHVSVGQVSALEPLTLLPRVQAGTVSRLALLGIAERVDAETALRVGLISEIVAADRLADRARELGAAIAGNSPAAVAATRRFLRAFDDQLLDEGWAAIRAHWDHPDAQEGPRAFIEKRPPRWTP